MLYAICEMDIARCDAALLGLGEEWNVTDVKLDVAARRIDIRLEHAERSAICPACGRPMPLHDQRPERTWRHLDTMPFETPIHAKAPDTCAATGKKSDVRGFLFPKRRVGRLNRAERQAQR